jgi:hypothetical protein
MVVRKQLVTDVLPTVNTVKMMHVLDVTLLIMLLPRELVLRRVMLFIMKMSLQEHVLPVIVLVVLVPAH